MTTIVYSDPNCPFCYATEERLHRLDLADAVQWRGVEHAPDLPVPMQRGTAHATALGGEVEAIRARAPEVEIAVPAAKPNTAAAIRLGGAALRRDRAAGRRFVRSLYRGFWVEGLDISEQAVLERLAVAAGLPDLLVGDEDASLTADWRRQWLETGLTGVPLLVRPDGRSVYGLVSEDELRAFLG
ncbi:MAG: DsbA family protein [Solirubrobacterales bacterium]